MKITEYKEIVALPVGTIASVTRRQGTCTWVKTSGSTWAMLPGNYTQEVADEYVARRVNNISPCNSEAHTVLNPGAVISALIKDVQNARLSADRQRQAGDRATYRLQQIEEFINGDHECEASA